MVFTVLKKPLLPSLCLKLLFHKYSHILFKIFSTEIKWQTAQGVFAMTVSRIVLMLSFIMVSFGQDNTMRFEHLTVEDGLSEGTVYSILQDSRGFMWFGTRFGLNRYDGHEFRVFNHDPKDSSSLPGHWVNALVEDKQGFVWVGTQENGVAIYDPITESFATLSHNETDTVSLSSDLVTCIFEDSQSSIWIGTKYGLNRFHPDQHVFEKFFHIEADSTSLADNVITTISELPGGILIVGLGSGELAKLSIQTGSIEKVAPEFFYPNRTSDRSIKYILKDRTHDYMWITRFGWGLTKYDLKSGILAHYEKIGIDPRGVASNYIIHMSQDQTGKLWLATVDGFTVFDPATEDYVYNDPDPKNPNSVNDHIVYSSYVDQHGIVWGGSEAKGLNIHKPHQTRFELFKHEPGKPQTPSANNVFSLAEDASGDIWFTTMPGGINRYNLSTKTYRYYKSDPHDLTLYSLNYAQQVMIDHLGMAWFGINTAGLMEFEPESGRRCHLFYPHVGNPKSLSGHTVQSLIETRNGTIWVGTKENGLNHYDRETRSFTRYKNDPDNPNSLQGERVYALLEDQAGVLWIGTAQGGLNRFNPATKTFSSYTYTPGSSNCIQSNVVMSLHEDQHQNLWIGTRGGGLNRLDSSRQNFSTLNLGSENIDITVAGIEEDDHGFLWLSTTDGIIKADPETGFLNRYTTRDGLQSNEFYYNSSLHDSRGYMYFGGPNGFNRFHPDSIVNNPHIPPVVITELFINYSKVPLGEMPDGRTILTKSIANTDAITLSHRDRVVSFSYSALDFTDPSRNRFAYKLENFDEDWVNAGSSHKATYTSLEPGEYIFRVKGSNNDGVWNEEGVALSITVKPPFWKTLWFKAGMSLLLIFMIFIYIRLRLRRVQAEKRKLEALVIERTDELRIEIEERQRVETEKMELKVEHLKRELVSKSVCATQKQEIMNNLFTELKDIQKMDANEMRTRFNRLIKYFKDMFSSDQSWEEFELWFTEVHTDFFTHLRAEHPELSQREVKVCALLKLNLLSKDIANLMNIQVNTVDIYRHRIRKKVGLQTDENLNQFFDQF